MQRSKRKGSVVRRDRKIIVYIATSADGYIARPDGSVSRLHYAPHHGPSPAVREARSRPDKVGSGAPAFERHPQNAGREAGDAQNPYPRA